MLILTLQISTLAFALESIRAMLIALVVGALFHCFGLVLFFAGVLDDDLFAMIFWMAVYMGISWLVILLPGRRHIVKLAKVRGQVDFAAAMSILALLCFMGLIGWIFIPSPIGWLLCADSMVIGAIFGTILWKEIRTSENEF